MIETPNGLHIREIISCLFILAGVIFMIIASIGLLRLPDFYIRMSAITKGTTLGLGLILAGMGIYFNQPEILLKVLAIILFTFITTPVAAHVIGRTAIQNRIPFWSRTNKQELKEYLQQEKLYSEELNTDQYKVEFAEKAKNAANENNTGNAPTDGEQKA